MNEQEKKCLDKTAELYNELNALDMSKEQGGSENDMLEMCIVIHSIQNYILSRSTLREYRKTEKL